MSRVVRMVQLPVRAAFVPASQPKFFHAATCCRHGSLPGYADPGWASWRSGRATYSSPPSILGP